MRSLFRKELWSLWPLLVVFSLVFLLDVGLAPLDRIDERAWSSGMFRDLFPGKGGAHTFFLGLFALITSYSLLPREHDDGTIEFLHALPVRPVTVFSVKVFAGFTLLLVTVAIDHAVQYLLTVSHDQTLNGRSFDPALAARVAFLQLSFATIMLCHGVFLSFLRRFGIMILGVFAIAVMLLTKRWPSFALLDLTQLMSLEYAGTELLMPWPELQLHGGLALLSLLLGAGLWLGLAERFFLTADEILESLALRAVFGCGTLGFVVLAVIGLVIVAEKDPDSDTTKKVVYESFRRVRAETERYIFTYPSSREARALELITRADRDYDRLAERLGLEPLDRKLTVEMTEQSSSAGGLALWTTLRVDMFSIEDPVELRSTLLHETTHAFQFLTARERMSEYRGCLKAFTEGMAEAYSHELSGEEETILPKVRLLAAAAWKRYDLRLAQLLDERRFEARFGEELEYAIGEIFVRAIVDAHGPEAPTRILKALGRKDAPRGLEPLPFWQNLLRAAGCDYERVRFAFESRLLADSEQFKDEIAAMPKLRAAVQTTEKGLLLRLLPESSRVFDPKSVSLLTRDKASQAKDQWRRFKGKRSEAVPGGLDFDLPRSVRLGGSFEYQLKWHDERLSLPLPTRWRRVSLRR